MKNIPTQWTRRAFSHALAFSTVSAVLPWTKPRQVWSDAQRWPTRAYVASCPTAQDSIGAIRVFTIKSGAWVLDQELECPSPAHLEQHPALPVVYAVHDVSLWDRRPRGAVSAYSIDPPNGKLCLRATQSLSLSATAPKHATVSRDGRDLVVAAHGGGSYNVLPLDDEGLPGPPRIIRKQLGRLHVGQAIPASPGRILRHPNSDLLIATDSGNQTITTFALTDDSMHPIDCMHLDSELGLAGMAFSLCAKWAFAIDTVHGTINTYPFVSATGALGPKSSVTEMPDRKPLSILMHPSGNALVAAALPRGKTSLSVYSVKPNGRLTLSHTTPLDRTLDKIFCVSGAEMLVATQASSTEILGFPLEDASLRPGASRVLAQVADTSSISFRSV
ncbi:MAG: hypothetical protein NVS9B15_18790 [Acidobacteriaceae bacterium]